MVRDPYIVPFRRGKKWGLSDRKRQIVVEPEYDSMQFSLFGGFEARKGRRWAFLDKDGNIVLPLKYHYIERVDKTIFTVGFRKTFATFLHGILRLRDFLVGAAHPSDFAKRFAKSLCVLGVVDEQGNTIVPIGSEAKVSDEPFHYASARHHVREFPRMRIPLVLLFLLWEIVSPLDWEDPRRELKRANGPWRCVDGQWFLTDGMGLEISQRRYDNIARPYALMHSTVVLVKCDGKWGTSILREQSIGRIEVRTVSKGPSLHSRRHMPHRNQ